MKILVLGGAGQEGRTTVSDLIDSEQLKSVVIGDLNLDAANRVDQLEEMIGSGQISEKGVFAPEGILDADAFLAELAKRDIGVKRIEEAG